MKLKRAGHESLFDKFEFIVCCSSDPEVKNGKPHPDAFDVARRRFQPIPEVKGLHVNNDKDHSRDPKKKMKKN